jgi:hypothetical protein
VTTEGAPAFSTAVEELGDTLKIPANKPLLRLRTRRQKALSER